MKEIIVCVVIIMLLTYYYYMLKKLLMWQFRKCRQAWENQMRLEYDRIASRVREDLKKELEHEKELERIKKINKAVIKDIAAAVKGMKGE